VLKLLIGRVSSYLLVFDNLRPALALLVISAAENVVFLLAFPWFEYIKIAINDQRCERFLRLIVNCFPKTKNSAVIVYFNYPFERKRVIYSFSFRSSSRNVILRILEVMLIPYNLYI